MIQQYVAYKWKNKILRTPSWGGGNQRNLDPSWGGGPKTFHPFSAKKPARYYSSKGGTEKIWTPLAGGTKILRTPWGGDQKKIHPFSAKKPVRYYTRLVPGPSAHFYAESASVPGYTIHAWTDDIDSIVTSIATMKTTCHVITKLGWTQEVMDKVK